MWLAVVSAAAAALAAPLFCFLGDFIMTGLTTVLSSKKSGFFLRILAGCRETGDHTRMIQEGEGFD